MSPIVFMFFKNDIFSCINAHAEGTVSIIDLSLCMLYADDVVLFFSLPNRLSLFKLCYMKYKITKIPGISP